MSWNRFVILLVVIASACSRIEAAKDPDCKGPPPKVDFKTCCPLPNLISDEIKEHCKAYLPPDEENVAAEKEGGRGFHKRPPPPHLACLMSCFFNETGFFVNNELNKPILINYLKNSLKVSAELLPALQGSFENCSLKVKERHEKHKKFHPDHFDSDEAGPGLKCEDLPAKIIGCVLMQTSLNCPKEIWNDTDECKAARDFRIKCKPKWGKHGKHHCRPHSSEIDSSDPEDSPKSSDSSSNSSDNVPKSSEGSVE